MVPVRRGTAATRRAGGAAAGAAAAALGAPRGGEGYWRHSKAKGAPGEVRRAAPAGGRPKESARGAGGAI